MYAIVKTGGKQYKVAVGDVVEVEKLDAAAGDEVDPVPLLLVDGADVTNDADALAKVTVTAEVVGADQGPEDQDPQVQEQDRLPQASGSPSAADRGQGHRHRRRPERSNEPWHTRRAHPAPATVATPTPSASASSASAARSSTPARSSSASAAPTSTPVTGVGRGSDDTLFALVEGSVQFGTRRGRKIVNIVVRPRSRPERTSSHTSSREAGSG